MALYRLPFEPEFGSTWTCSGNWDVGGAHGPGDPGDHADGQCYAFDLGHKTGGKILAARAGLVIDMLNDVPDDTNPPGKGAGNYVWIRHADKTVAAYCHLRCDSVRVKKQQWVPQGWWIGNSGATGNTIPQPNPHLHFDVRTAAEPGVFSTPSLGTSLLIHFEANSSASFRPVAGEHLSMKSNNVEGDYRQDDWRHCNKCRALYFAGNPGSTCPAGGEHAHGGGGIYTLSVDAWKPTGQQHWRYCTKCHALFFGDSATSRCPVGRLDAGHAGAPSSYALREAGSGVPGQPGWRWCKNCAVLWFEAVGSKCPATGGSHSTVGSGNYQLHVTAADWQRDWRLCGACGGLYFSGAGGSTCAGNGGGSHTPAKGALPYLPNYFLSVDAADAPGQQGWRWCSKCSCLWMGLNPGSVCHAGGAHTTTGSGTYAVIESTVQAPGQPGWRWCHKCQSLWYAPFGSTMACPAGGSHAQTGGQYWVQFFGHA